MIDRNVVAAIWRKSTRCETSACVEITEVDNGVLMRDAKNPAGTTLAFNRRQWLDFVGHLKEQS